MDIKSLLDQPNKLPTVPKVTQQLIQSFSDEDVAFDDIATQLAADPALSAKLLRLANSAYFNLSRTIGTVNDALRMLGFVMVRNLVLGNGMAATFRNTKGLDLAQFWKYNLYTACAARWVAAEADVNSDLTFTVALMHSIGQLHLHVVVPTEIAVLDKKLHLLDGGRAQLEKQELGFHFGDVSAELAKLWNFPAPIVEALRDVPDPLHSKEFSAAAACVHIGAWAARKAVLGEKSEAMHNDRPDAIGAKIGLDLEKAAADMPAMQDLTAGMEAMLE
jgi:HD-like signal output (HDOD) protein